MPHPAVPSPFQFHLLKFVYGLLSPYEQKEAWVRHRHSYAMHGICDYHYWMRRIR